MAGEFLPPVVTTLDGDIQPLLDKLAQAKAAIKSLGDTKITIRADVDQGSFARATAATTALAATTSMLADRTQKATGVNNKFADSIVAIDAASKRANSGSGGRTMPGWLGWMTDPGNIDKLHALGVAAVGVAAGLTGMALGITTVAAAWSKGAIQMGNAAKSLYQATSGMGGNIPRAFGLSGVGPWQNATAIGQGQIYGAYGGILAELNKPGGLISGALANEGTNIGAGIDTLLAKMDMSASKGQGFITFLDTVNQDAKGLGNTLMGVGAILGNVLKHSPGEIEWLMQGTGDVFKGLANFTSTGVGGDLLGGLMMLHTLTFLSGLGGKALGKLGLTTEEFALHGGFGTAGGNIMNLFGGLANIPSVGLMKLSKALPEDSAMATKLASAAESAGGLDTALAGLGGAPLLAIGAIATAAGLIAFYFANAKTQATQFVDSINGKINNSVIGQVIPVASQGMSQEFQRYISGVTNLDQIKSKLDGQRGSGFYENVVLGGQNQTYFQGMIEASHAMGTTRAFAESLAKTLHVSLPQAYADASMAGIKYSSISKGTAKEFAQQTQAVQNYMKAFRLLNGTTGEGFANAGVVGLMNGQAMKNTGVVNSAWDAYFSMLGGGGTGLGNLYQVLARLNPTAARNLSSPTGFIAMSQGLSSGAAGLGDWLRQAQTYGSIGGKQEQQGILDTAQLMMKLAGSNKAAQQEALAFASSSGIAVTSLGQLKAMTGGDTGAQKSLNKILQDGTIAMAKMTPAAKEMAQAINNEVTSAMSQAKLQSSGFQDALNKLKPVLSGQIPQASAQGKAAILNVEQSMIKAGMGATQAKQLIQAMGLQWQKIPAHSVKTATLNNNAHQAGKDFIFAESAWRMVHGGTKTFTSVYDAIYKTQGAAANASWVQNALAPAHNALGVRDSIMGSWSWVGERGPELAYLPSGSHVIPGHRVGQTLAAGMHAGGGEIHNHIYIDGKELFTATKKQTYQYNVNNGNRSAGGRPKGTMVPR